MKFHEDGKGLTLESADEVAEFNKLVDLARRRETVQKERAQRVFDVFLSGLEPVVPLSSLLDESSQSGVDWVVLMNTAIENDLDHRSIAHFVELVTQWSDRAAQVAKALKRHAENHSMKAEAFTWLDENMQNFRSMDKAAEAIANKVVPIAFRTARQWVGEWKKTRSTGKA